MACLDVSASKSLAASTRDNSEKAAVMPTTLTTFDVLRDVAAALQCPPYVGAVAIVTVKGLEIREVSLSLTISRAY